MNKTFCALIATALLLLITSHSHAALFSLSGAMDPFQALTNPDSVGNGNGLISGDYDDATNTLNYTLTWGDLTSAVTVIHFHVGEVGVSGGVDLGVPGPFVSGLSGSGIVLSDAQEANLLAGNWYVNIHTMNFGGGEIRGQVNVSPVPVPAAVWLFGSALGLLGWLRRG